MKRAPMDGTRLIQKQQHQRKETKKKNNVEWWKGIDITWQSAVWLGRNKSTRSKEWQGECTRKGGSRVEMGLGRRMDVWNTQPTHTHTHTHIYSSDSRFSTVPLLRRFIRQIHQDILSINLLVCRARFICTCSQPSNVLSAVSGEHTDLTLIQVNTKFCLHTTLYAPRVIYYIKLLK